MELVEFIYNTGFPDRSIGKESACNAGDPGFIPELGRSSGEGIGYPLQYSWVSLVAQLVKESTYNAGDPDSIPGLGRSPGEGKSYPLQYSGLENSMDCIVHRVLKSQTRLSDFHFTSLPLLLGFYKGPTLSLFWAGSHLLLHTGRWYCHTWNVLEFSHPHACLQVQHPSSMSCCLQTRWICSSSWHEVCRASVPITPSWSKRTFPRWVSW